MCLSTYQSLNCYIRPVLLNSLMKKVFLFCILILICISIQSKAQITLLNKYQYVYLAPLKYTNGSSDRWGIREQVKAKLQASGLMVLDSLSTRIMPSLTATCIIEHSSNLYQLKSEYIEVKFLDFDNKIIYAAQGKTGAVALTIKSGYRTGTKNALKEFDNYHYTYTGSSIQ